jgi:spore coat protein U-like protein
MAGGSSEFVTYELYRDVNRSQRWGSTVGTDTLSGTGNGNAQSATVYGRVAPQATPSPSAYTDTITVNVTY